MTGIFDPSLIRFIMFTCSCPKESWAVVRGKNGDEGKVELCAQGGHQHLEQEQPGKFSPQSISRGVLRLGSRQGTIETLNIRIIQICPT